MPIFRICECGNRYHRPRDATCCIFCDPDIEWKFGNPTKKEDD